MEEILNGDDYEVVKTNPTPKLKKKLNNMLKGLWEGGEINKIGYEGRGSHGKSTVTSCGKHLHGAL